MPARVHAITCFSEASTPLSRASTIYSTASDGDSLDAVTIVNPHNQIIEVAAQPDFYIFTSLLWIRGFGEVIGNTSSCADSENTAPSTTDPSSVALNATEPDLGLLKYHLDRLVAAAEALQWRHIHALDDPEAGLNILQSNIHLYLQCLPALLPNRIERRKVRIMINKIGAIRIDSTIMDCSLAKDYDLRASNFVPVSLDSSQQENVAMGTQGELDKISQVSVDSRSTRPSLFTSHKTSHRIAYDTARARAKITASPPTAKEVLLHNKNGEIMEASLCTAYFWRDGAWITPAAICGGNLGVTRRMALERGLCKQGSIDIAELQNGEKIWLSNGARGFFLGQIVL